MLPEMKYIESELLPMLRERKEKHDKSAAKQLRQWRGEKGVCSLLLQARGFDEAKRLPDYNNYEIHYDPEKMFVSQLKGALSAALADGDAVPSVRANVGCGCINTLVGGIKQTFYEDKMPWLTEHIEISEIMEIAEDSVHASEEFARGLEQMRFMKEMLKGTGIQIYPMDLQGPVDMAHLFLGNEFFYAVYDDEDAVHKALSLSVACAIYAMEENFKIIQPDEYVCHYNGLVMDKNMPLKVSEDTSTLLSRAHLEAYMKPYTEKLLAHFGGGYIHYCGDNKHLLEMVPDIAGNRGLNFGNPERHDPDSVLDALKKRNQCYYGAFPNLSVSEHVAKAKREDGAFSIFLTTSCDRNDQAHVIDEFESAVNR